MTTEQVVEAILNINPYTEKLFRAAHVINDTDRKWKAKPHSEYPFLKYFFDPKFIVIISKQIHVYLVGDKDKGKTYHIINIEGYHADHLVTPLKDLTGKIKEAVSAKLFLPNNFYDRIIYMHDEELFIFNRVTALNCNMFTSKSKWTFGTTADTIYNVDYEANINEKNTSAYEILNQIYDTIESEYKAKVDDSNK